MTRLVRQALILVLAAWLAGASAALAAGSGEGPAAAEAQTARGQVLVMLRMAPQHFRPNGDYGAGYDDRLGLNARRMLASRIAREHGLVLVTSWPMPLLSLDCYVMAIPDDRSPEAVAAALSNGPGVAWAQPMGEFRAQGGPPSYNDPLFPVQPAAHEWRLADLHEIATGRNVRIAVIDSMVEANHPDLAGQVQLSENFIDARPSAPEAHGTGVAGVIAAIGNNGLGIVGVAPHARLMALRACWQSPEPHGAPATLCDTLSLAKALHFAVAHDAQIINLSLAGPSDPLLGKLIDVALARGVTVVAAYDPNLPAGGFPASHPGVIAVADEASGAPRPGAYLAPGRDIPTTQPGRRWYLVSGSSYAAAHVSGLFALLREKAPGGRAAVELVSAARRGGAIDACASLLRAAGPCGCACARPPGVIARR